MACRIMIVDDEMPIRRLMMRLLKRDGYEVVAVARAEEALQELSCSPVDAVVTDRFLPNYDGIELARKIKRQYPGIPVVMVSGDLPEEKGLDKLIDAFLAKPLADAGEVLMVVREVLKRQAPGKTKGGKT